MRQIELSQGKVSLVDDVDFEWLNQWKWYAWKSGNTFYALRTTKKGTTFRIHRELLGLRFGDGRQVDHVNGNGLDNRRENLRTCTSAQNQYNQKIRQGSSRFKGVRWSKRDKRWYARIRFNGKQIHLGTFVVEVDAAKTYNKAAIKMHGKFAKLNIVMHKRVG